MPINALLVREAKLATDSNVAMMAGLLGNSLPIPKPVFIPTGSGIEGKECCKGGKTCSCGVEQKTFFELLLAKVANERGLGVPLHVVLREIKERYGRSSVASIKLTLEVGQDWPVFPKE